MTTLNQDPVDLENKVAFESIKQTEATLVCGVSRKINIGNFENIDVYCSLTLPVDITDIADIDDLKAIVSSVAAEGFGMTSQETTNRYKAIKELLS